VADVPAKGSSTTVEFGDEGRIMTGQEAERTPHAAYLDTCMPPAGSSTLMPPPSQGAERQMERRARRTRWGLRTLVVGGLAGAAWLLTGAAAHAADRTDGPTGSLLGSVVGSDAVSPVTSLLMAAAQPLESTGPAHEHHSVVTSVLDVPHRVLSHPARQHDEAGNDHIGSPIAVAVGAVDQALQEVTAPIRLTGGLASTPHLLTALAAPVAETRAPAGGKSPKPAAEPAATPARDRASSANDKASSASDNASSANDKVSSASDNALSASDKVSSASDKASSASDQASLTSDKTAVPVITSTTSIKAPHDPASAPRATTPVSHRASTDRPAHRHHATVSAAVVPGSVRDEGPVGDGPAAPLQLHLGDVSGTSTSGSGTPTEGGAPAFLPAAIADSTMARHLLPVATIVEVRRHDAEAPTVSPD
jgi:hypothetical protein